MAKPKGKYYIIYEGLAEVSMEEDQYESYEEALCIAKDSAQECCMNYTIVQAVAEVQYKTSVKVKRF